MPSISSTTHYLSLTNTEIPFTAITTTKNSPSLPCSDITISYSATLINGGILPSFVTLNSASLKFVVASNDAAHAGTYTIRLIGSS